MSMELLTLSIKGTSPLMMHSDKLANPLHPATKAHKELTAKRKKTDEDHLAIARSEFIAGAYFDSASGFFIPGANFDATFLAGAKLQKLGTHWKRGALVMTDKAELKFAGPSTPESLWEDQRFVDCRGVKVGQAKIMRYRPIFLDWACQLEVAINADVLDLQEVKKAIEDSGKLIGVCEYRPRFGRFEVAYV
ncbi:hypothetical protein CXG50_12340 [Pseudomonas plecoglossicida]|uniref:hypothetical protein n=1 Tax=Pseudomonas TaxID=286 RepID=UPI0002A16CD4|nr:MULTISPECIES: hypothetical protein [Pseudomonas]AGA72986.1 hypothetical protein B479_10420 [Pseudomonas putida HB3267]MCE0946198.1 hypothetical protein [Pseudomonas asiatica]MCE1067183.1 hypothetical protein [Pseudomonas asiatica]MCE1101982.1 hypothetical protein [Pseudomonas asiatica]MCE1107516.1 hypothetical protein [Pseudomonas asiatica]